MIIEMHDPQGQLLEELKQPGITQYSVALTYAFVIRQLGDKADYKKLNAAIQQRWRGKSALERVKKMASDALDGKYRYIMNGKQRGKRRAR